MGKKYIIELPENTHWIQWLMEGTEDHHPYMDFKQVEDLAPYIFPDFEQVRKEAYEAGAKSSAIVIADDKAHEAYQRGLNDAWEAARKIGNIPYGEEEKAFGSGGWHFIQQHTASEAIAKIKEYEDSKQEYRVGDEFENEAGKKFVVLKMDGKEIDRYIDSDGKTYVMNVKYRVMRKTGRSFPEIAAVLEKMRGEQE